MGDETGAAAATANGPFSCLLLCERGAVGHCQDWPNHFSVPSNPQLCDNTVSAQDCASPHNVLGILYTYIGH